MLPDNSARRLARPAAKLLAARMRVREDGGETNPAALKLRSGSSALVPCHRHTARSKKPWCSDTPCVDTETLAYMQAQANDQVKQRRQSADVFHEDAQWTSRPRKSLPSG